MAQLATALNSTFDGKVNWAAEAQIMFSYAATMLSLRQLVAPTRYRSKSHVTSFERAIDSPATVSPSLTVSATPDQLPVLRSLVRTVAAHYALSLDGLSDLVLAADEAACILISHALPSATLTCVFDGDTDLNSARVMLSTSTTGEITTSTSSFGWHVLEILVDGVVLEQIPPASPEQTRAATITLTKGLQAGS